MSTLQTKTVLEHISEHLNNRDLCFVFPSAVVSRFWAERSAESFMKPLDLSRFIAWDEFKEACFSPDHTGLYCSNQASRVLFSASLLKENADTGKNGLPLLHELISPEYAQNYTAFLGSVSRLLSPLDHVIRQLEKSGDIADDPYFADLSLIHKRYTLFLEKYRLYEPAWEKAPFKKSLNRWLLILPELADDWPDYASELGREESVQCIHIDQFLAEKTADPAAFTLLENRLDHVTRYDNSEDEVRQLFLTIRHLLDTGIPPGDIAISVADLNSYEQRLHLEASLRMVPVSIRKGRSISEYPGGRIFSSFASCSAARWSYQVFRELLLDKAFSWREEKTIQQLMDFGLKYRCLSGYTEKGQNIDVWEKTFEHLEKEQSAVFVPLGKLRNFYRAIKRDILGILQAESFSDLRENILMFTTNHIDRDLLPNKTNSVFSRALEELSRLVETEELLQGLPIPSPFSIFLNRLNETAYVFQDDHTGIPVYEYRVSAGLHPAIHFLLNMNQDTLTIRSDKAFFLREDRKIRLGMEDRDISSDYIMAYRESGSLVCASYAETGFSGYGIPHRRFSEEPFQGIIAASELARLPDEYAIEEGREALHKQNVRPTHLQRESRAAAGCIRNPERHPDIRFNRLGSEQLLNQLTLTLAKDRDCYLLSPTDLNRYLSCPFAWFLSKGLSIQDKQTGIETIDQKDLGILYHRILERLFKRIQAEGGRFRSENIYKYRAYLREELDAALEEGRRNEGAFQESVYAMLRTRIESALNDYLDNDLELLNGSSILGAEYPLYMEYPELHAALGGIADLVLQTDDGGLVITDFKTGLIPAAGDLLPDGELGAADLQLASYIRMIENSLKEKVAYARFYSIDNRQFQEVLDPVKEPKRNALLPVDRDAYQDTILQTDDVLAQLVDSLTLGEFPVLEPQFRKTCYSCRVASVCRIIFSGGEA